jgi:UDP-glucose 4-epimerase
MAELALSSYANSFGLRVACVRFFSVYGPGLRKQLLWDACSKLAKGVPVLALGGGGSEVRDWLHVEDAARLLFEATAHASSSCQIVNCGTGVGTTVQSIAKQLLLSWNGNTSLSFSGLARAGDPQSLVANSALAQSWGWTAQHGWESGIAEYVAWFKTVNREAK